MEKFLQQYMQRFGARGPPPYAFDAVNVLVDAMVRAGSADPSGICRHCAAPLATKE